ncbi:MAG: FAD-dependent monooxygenase [Gammaproteobacteria bacterium]|nr:FAD-dependent monooxygenase [Gammaproteobacteria bacterium]
MNLDQHQPVLIVGAGPTGMVLANELLRRRVPCRMIDKRSGPTETSRSFTLHARTMEMFEHMGLAHRFLRDGLKSRGFLFNFKGKDVQPALDFTGLDSDYPYILIYNQNETEQRLREHLDATYAFHPEWGVELTAFTEAGDNYRATLRNRAGEEQLIHPRWIAGCDGIHSFVRENAGLEFSGENYEGMVMQMMDVDYTGFDGADDWIHYYMSKDSFLLLTKLSSGRHRVLISDMGEADDPNLTRRQAFQSIIDGHINGTELAEPEWATKWELWRRITSSYSKAGIFLAGDAAHVHSPSGGQGMNVSMQDAFNLGWKLAMVQHGYARSKLLDTYTSERKPVGTQVIAGTHAMHDIIMAHGHGMDDRLQLTRREGWHSDTVNLISGLSYTYRDVIDITAGLKSLPGPACGDRVGNVEFSGNRQLYDLTRTGRLNLFIVEKSGATDAEAVTLQRRISEQYAHVVHSVILSERRLEGMHSANMVADGKGQFAERYGELNGGQLLLIRPDSYIAFRSHFDEAERLFEYLNIWFMPLRRL